MLLALGLWGAALGLPAGSPAPVPCREGLLCGRPLDLNRASTEHLEALPGIGPARARAIAAARPFVRVEELRRVPGIGPVTLEALRPRVALDPGPGGRGAAP